VADPADHILVAQTDQNFIGTSPSTTIVVKRTAFLPGELAGFSAALGAVPETASLFAPAGTAGSAPVPGPVARYMATANAGLGAFYASYPFDVTPTTDNDPFFWHFARFGTVVAGYGHSLSSADRENAVGERVLLLLLVLSAAIAAVFLLLPFAAIRSTWVQLPHKALSGVFFAGVGFGFIFFEITLMQLLNLFLGYPTYALTVTLMALLVFTGLGALASMRVQRPRRAVTVLLGIVVGLCSFYLLGLGPLTRALLVAPMAARVALSVAVLAPLGLCLGMFMPLGLREIARRSPHPRTYVAWGWAANGFASVVGSAAATILAMSYGFDLVLGLGLACYVVATAAWVRLTAVPAPVAA